MGRQTGCRFEGGTGWSMKMRLWPIYRPAGHDGHLLGYCCHDGHETYAKRNAVKMGTIVSLMDSAGSYPSL